MQSNDPSIPAPTAAPDFPSNFGIHLFRAAHLWRREANKVLAESGFSSSVISPLMLLNELGDGMRQRDLAEEMGVEGPSLVRLLDSLEAAKLVERREAPDDRRAKTLHLTDEGRDMLVRVNTALNDVRRRLLEGASGPEIAGAMRAMAAIESNARAMKG
ncbi:MarR family transcriptional regulator [Azospirillum brasilense]|uniref:MarR family transcriptional regulator n=1 Tax=Azospirillum brasilense TaxID=192 RepID=A0A0P0F3Z9_AZOBR|nr:MULTISPECIES: MarR family transcriptional regulator [Azospirillum]ALJ37750.1 MarR family transcriptional regulator [Azospirillum brasilense]MDW7556504.1 MarR family transcriptional regulator [Azospirillum brasilense]MDW7592586.1 MarR family transcriptional regulator [Azospirillum brasilense]MDW7628116.1 MarR family transcriptional regulator [Azospirillum brasilense]MDX5952054.1 MarR family transcriptional regulator [Azospirillum brasilense]